MINLYDTNTYKLLYCSSLYLLGRPTYNFVEILYVGALWSAEAAQ